MTARSHVARWLRRGRISDAAFLAAIGEATRRRTVDSEVTFESASKWDIAAVLLGRPEQVGAPEAVTFPTDAVLRAAARLIRKGKVGGCLCGCRGDFVDLTDLTRTTRADGGYRLALLMNPAAASPAADGYPRRPVFGSGESFTVAWPDESDDDPDACPAQEWT